MTFGVGHCFGKGVVLIKEVVDCISQDVVPFLFYKQSLRTTVYHIDMAVIAEYQCSLGMQLYYGAHNKRLSP